jgi:membrane associated rhomboid family serine protease
MFQKPSPVVWTLLVANISVFALETLTQGHGFTPLALWPWGGQGGAPSFEPWQLVTYAFLHAGWAHLFANMLALYMFGPDTEDLLGSRRFAVFYFVCVVGAALTQLLVMSRLYPSPEPTVGASGGIFGVLLLYAMAFPHRRIMLLFPPIPMPAWLFVAGYGALELYLGVFQTAQGVAHFAHLGGMAFGFVLIRYWMATGALRLRRYI